MPCLFVERFRAIRPAWPLRRARGAARGQTLLEVAIILPIFLVVLMAVIEFGWYAAVASATTSASREAARYGSTVGTGGGGSERYIDCDGIRNAGRSTTSPLITLDDADIVVSYDDGFGTATAQPCVSTASRPAKSDLVRFDRVVVTVTVEYRALTPLMGPFIGTTDLVSTDRRSIVKP